MSCVVCKSIYIPGSTKRSFHKFPKNDELRQKWIDIIGKPNVAKTSRICSDHFLPSSFQQTDGYTTLNRLLPNSVPVLNPIVVLNDITNESNTLNDIVISNITSLSNTFKEEKSSEIMVLSNENGLESVFINDNEEKEELERFNSFTPLDEDYARIKMCLVNNRDETNSLVNENHFGEISNLVNNSENNDVNILYNNESNDCNIVDDSESDDDNIIDNSESDDSIKNCKRKTLTRRQKNINRTKFRFMDGFVTKYISKTDFKTNEGWENFMRYVSVQNVRTESIRKKSYRRKKKIDCLKELLSQIINGWNERGAKVAVKH